MTAGFLSKHLDVTERTIYRDYSTWHFYHRCDEAIKHIDLLGARFGAAGVAPPMTLLGVSRLAIAGLMFEIEATAAWIIHGIDSISLDL